jgi:TolB-like protein/Flp pilus assembly protein TadD
MQVWVPVLVQEIQRFLEELRRRKVYRVAAAYAAFAFVLVQVADLTLPVFDVSNRTYRATVILALLGFPVAVILAWVFEWTPDGVQVTRAASAGSRSQSEGSVRKVAFELLVAVLAVGATVGASWYLAKLGTPAVDITDRSIAVLPFESVNDEEPGSFVDGLHDDLLTRLSGIHGFSVIAQSSVERYRGTNKALPEIAAELGVRWILEGTVQQTGGQARVTVRLVDPIPGVQAWGDSYLYDLSAANIFGAQSEIAHEIAEALQTRLTPQEERIVSTMPTENLQAYRLVVEARTLIAQREEPQMRRALSLFEQATELDPTFSLAWVGIADALYELVDYEFQMPAGSIDRAMQAAEYALELDPENPAAYVSLGIIQHLQQDGLEAIRKLEHAIELRPGYADAFSKISWVAQILGRPQLAAEAAEKAFELDPLAVEPRVNFAMTRVIEGDSQFALEVLRSERDLVQEWPTIRFYEGVVLYHMGRYADAKDVLRDLSIPWAGAGPAAAEALASVALGDMAAATSILVELKESGAHPFLVGLVHASIGDYEAAFTEFDSIKDWTIDADWPVLAARYLFQDVLGDLRTDPRYDRLLRSIDREWGLVM